jgi:hypothetical protein
LNDAFNDKCTDKTAEGVGYGERANHFSVRSIPRKEPSPRS